MNLFRIHEMSRVWRVVGIWIYPRYSAVSVFRFAVSVLFFAGCCFWEHCRFVITFPGGEPEYSRWFQPPVIGPSHCPCALKGRCTAPLFRPPIPKSQRPFRTPSNYRHLFPVVETTGYITQPLRGSECRFHRRIKKPLMVPFS
jgi:hypothetical protein